MQLTIAKKMTTHFTRMHCEHQNKKTEKGDRKSANDKKFQHNEEINLRIYACRSKYVHSHLLIFSDRNDKMYIRHLFVFSIQDRGDQDNGDLGTRRDNQCEIFPKDSFSSFIST